MLEEVKTIELNLNGLAAYSVHAPDEKEEEIEIDVDLSEVL